MVVCIYGWMNGWMDGRLVSWLAVCMCGCMSGWMPGSVLSEPKQDAASSTNSLFLESIVSFAPCTQVVWEEKVIEV